MQTVGERIRTEREAQGISRTDLAKRCGMKSPSTLSDLELGYSKKSMALHRIAEALGVHSRWLETGAGEKYVTSSDGDNPDMADLRIGLALTVQALAFAAPDGARRLAERLESLPNGLPGRPYLKALIDTIRAELAQRAMLPAPPPQAPESDSRTQR